MCKTETNKISWRATQEENIMSKFNVGDIVRGNDESGRYGYTTKYMVGRVTANSQGRYDERITVKILQHSQYPTQIGREYEVESQHFDKLNGLKKPKVVKVAPVVEPTPEVIPAMKITVEGKVTYILIEGKYTIAIPTVAPIGIATKHEEDTYSEESGKALAMYRLNKKVEVK